MSSEITSELPAVSRLLTGAFEKSGLTETELAKSAGISVGATRVALSGVRHHRGETVRAPSPDYVVTRLAYSLGVDEAALYEAGRGLAAQLLATMKFAKALTVRDAAADAAHPRGTRGLASVPTAELRAELVRRLSRPLAAPSPRGAGHLT